MLVKRLSQESKLESLLLSYLNCHHCCLWIKEGGGPLCLGLTPGVT